jgi:hypothetical protein
VEQDQQPAVYSWGTSIALAVGLTIAAVALIIVFTDLVDWVGGFWSQVIYFTAVFGGVVVLAERSRRRDEADRRRLGHAASPITPAGLPGPFVVTQALGVLGIVMVVVAQFGSLIGGNAQLLWVWSGVVLILVGAVGLVFWLNGLRTVRRTDVSRA